MKRKRCALFFLLLSHLITNSFAQGLLFHGSEKRISERSSFQVFTDDNLPDFSEETSISFEYSAQNLESSGYILFLKDKKNGKAYNLTYLYEKDKGNCSFIFSEDGKKAYYAVTHKERDVKRRWIPMSLHIYNNQNKAEIRIGKDSISLKNIELEGRIFSPQLYFGMCDYILEIASFSIRNLSISNGKKIWNIPLNESSGEFVHDSSGKIIGNVKNPAWLINQSYFWKENFTYCSSSPTGFVFDKKLQKMLIYNKDSLISYDWYTKEATAHSFSNTFPFNLRLGMNFLDEKSGDVYAYELTQGKMIACFSPSVIEWKKVQLDTINDYLCLHHHSGYYHPEDRKLIIFGGYGNRKYSDTFLSYDVSTNRWDTIHFSGDKIIPRFFFGAAVSPNHKRMYIHGGKGNETGDQNIGLEYFNDLYQVDLEKQTVQKLWRHDPPKVNRVVARNMVLSKDEKSIYFLGYPEYMPNSFVQLYRMSIEDGICEALGDSIPMVSEEIATNVNLYFDEELEEFYCSVQEFEKYGNTTTRIFSLVAPPASLAAVRYYDLKKAKSVPWVKCSIAAVLIMAVAGLFCFYFSIRRKRPMKHVAATNILSSEENLGILENVSPAETSEETIPIIKEVHFKNRNAIYLFGMFAVLDRDGKDITYMFSPKLRTIFLYILLKSVSGDGVLSSDMNELFWPEKTDDKVKNLKGVTVNHIRKLLQEMDGIELIYEKGRFHLDFRDDFYCDYASFSSLLKEEKKIDLKKEVIDNLLKILVRGKFLNGIPHELFDFYKHEVEEFILALLPTEIDKACKGANFMMTVRLCNVWTSIDPLSEEALYYSVCSYQKLNHPTEALKRYSSFVTAYKKAMNEEYAVKYENISSLIK